MTLYHETNRIGILKTGQTTQYGGYEDDGYFEKGIAKAYTVLTTGQYSGTVAITLNGKTDNHSNNCVLDIRTGLMWSRYVSASVGTGSDGKLPWTTNGSGEGVFTFCAAANAASLGGYTDWRVCNRAETESLLSWEAPNVSLDGTAFPSFPADYVWLSTTVPALTTNAILLRTSGDSIVLGYNRDAKTTGAYYCLLVRGG